MVIEHGRSLVEATSMPGILERELLKVEMMAELVAKGAQKCAKRCDLFAHRRSQPDPD
jgi:hypothetical protein